MAAVQLSSRSGSSLAWTARGWRARAGKSFVCLAGESRVCVKAHAMYGLLGRGEAVARDFMRRRRAFVVWGVSRSLVEKSNEPPPHFSSPPGGSSSAVARTSGRTTLFVMLFWMGGLGCRGNFGVWAEGPTVARHYAERHYQNETYVMGVDSHCHFVRCWDNVQIDMFRRIGNDHAIITAYPGSADCPACSKAATARRSTARQVWLHRRAIRRTGRVNVHNTFLQA